jgi:hypothetical protein
MQISRRYRRPWTETATPGLRPGAASGSSPSGGEMPVKKRLPVRNDIRLRLALVAVIPPTAGMIAWPVAWVIVALAQR